MTTTTELVRTHLVDFLRARLAEDGAAASSGAHPKRAAAEVAAKEQIVRVAETFLTTEGRGGVLDDSPIMAMYALRALAWIYVDHPEFPREWCMETA